MSHVLEANLYRPLYSLPTAEFAIWNFVRFVLIPHIRAKIGAKEPTAPRKEEEATGASVKKPAVMTPHRTSKP